MSLSNPLEAERYIKEHAKGAKVDLGLEVQNGKIKVDQRKRVRVDHVAMAEVLTKFINTTPNLNMTARRIMTMKIVNPGMTNLAVAIAIGIREFDVKKYEEDGKNRVKEWMRVSSVLDGVKAFEKNKGALNENQRFVEKHIHHDSPLIRE